MDEESVLKYLWDNPNSRHGSILYHFKTTTENENLKRKDVNKILYRLLSQKKAVKTANSDGTKPKWSADETGGSPS